MKKMYHIYRFIIVGLMLCQSMTTYATSILIPTTTDEFIDKIKLYDTDITESISLSHNLQDTRELIQQFCATVLDTTADKNYFYLEPIPSQKSYFAARQSAFLYILCKPGGFERHFGQQPSAGSSQKTHIEQADFTSLLHKQEWSDYAITCNPETTLDGCHLEREIHQIITTLINDISNIALASSYGIMGFNTGQKEKNITDFANDFGKHYFDQHTILCDPESPIDRTCQYPLTLAHLTSFLQKADSLAQQNSTFNLKKLHQSVKDPSKLVCLQDITVANTTQYNNYYCGLLGQGTEDALIPAKLSDLNNLIYNELRRYRMFVAYYAHELEHNPLLQTRTAATDTNYNAKGKEQAAGMIYQSNVIVRATEKTIDKIGQVQYTFPIHIGLVMYTERLLEMRKALTKIYTPLHQLYYKLRNVQQAK